MSKEIYSQRNTLAVALAWMTLKAGGKAGRGFDKEIAERGSEAGWGHVLYIDTPSGQQISYHFAPSDADLLEGLPVYSGTWDGTYLGRDSYWLNEYSLTPSESGRTARQIAVDRLSQASIRRWFIEEKKLMADTDVTPEVREAILRGYAERWS